MPTVRDFNSPSSVGFSLPLSLTHGQVARWQFVQHPQQHAQGVFSDRVPVAFRAVVHRDAQFFGQGGVDVFQPRSAPGYPCQFRQRVKHLRIETDAAPQHKAMDGPKRS